LISDFHVHSANKAFKFGDYHLLFFFFLASFAAAAAAFSRYKKIVKTSTKHNKVNAIQRIPACELLPQPLPLP
jgi:hypothetical protein